MGGGTGGVRSTRARGSGGVVVGLAWLGRAKKGACLLGWEKGSRLKGETRVGARAAGSSLARTKVGSRELRALSTEWVWVEIRAECGSLCGLVSASSALLSDGAGSRSDSLRRAAAARTLVPLAPL